ncbi:MAG: hypothetical protein WCC21_13160 [Candidatus Acidiferrales bacterium]
MDERERAKEILRALPLSEKQRKLYEDGSDKLPEEKLVANNRKLEAALKEAPKVLEDARQLLKEQLQRPKDPSP